MSGPHEADRPVPRYARDPAKYFGGGGPEDATQHEPIQPTPRRRERAEVIGPWAGAIALTLLLGIGVYAFASAGQACKDALTLDVAVAPGIEPAMANAARRFNADRFQAGAGPTPSDGSYPGAGRCTRAVVRKADPAAMAALLAGRSVPGRTDRRPDVWIPDSSLWIAVAKSQAPSKNGKKTDPGIETTRTSIARSPIVVALPQTLAASLKTKRPPSWIELLRATGATAPSRNAVIPPGSARLLVPDPARNAAGMHALVLTDTLLARDRNRSEVFSGVVRTVRENTLPTVQAEFQRFRPQKSGRRPVALASERDVWAFNQTKPAEPAVALHPRDGTLSLDHPYTITAKDQARRNAAGLLERTMTTKPVQDDVQSLGYRTAKGTPGVSTAKTRELPAPQTARVGQVMQSWSRLSLGIRILTLLDVSGTMAEPIAPGVNRLQATARTAQSGLSMMPNDTELGVWAFSTLLRGNQDWRELVAVGPLGERVGSVTRRQLILSSLGAIRPKLTGNTGLFETLTAAYKEMTLSYKPEFVNTVLLFTDGKGNDDPGGPTLTRTLADLRAITDPGRPVQIIMIGVGGNVDTRELRQIARVVPGAVYVAESPGEIGQIFLEALSRRLSDRPR